MPAPPQQSVIQRAAFQNRSVAAAAASAAALPKLVELVEFCTANTTPSIFGTSLCPGMSDVTEGGRLAPHPSASQILDRFSESLRAVEVGHGFNPTLKFTNLHTVLGAEYPFTPNLWQPCALGIGQCASATDKEMHKQDLIQQELFDSANFTEFPPIDFHEASDRVLYTAVDFYHSPVANSNHFGGFVVVLRPDYIRKLALMTPRDSGWLLVQARTSRLFEYRQTRTLCCGVDNRPTCSCLPKKHSRARRAGTAA